MTQATRLSSSSLPETTLHNFNFMRHALALAVILTLQVKVGVAQEVDSNVLQREAEAAEKARAQKDAARQQQQEQQQQQRQQGAPNQPGQPAEGTPAVDQQTPAPTTGPVTIPAGTKLQLGLVRPLSVKKTNPGDSAYLQITFPVSVGSEMVVPPGTYLQGTIGKIIRRDRGRALLEFELSSTSLIYSTGYTVNFPGAVDAAPTYAELRAPGPGNALHVPAVGAMAATGTPPAPLPLPSLGNGPRNAVIALGVTAAAGVAMMLVAMSHSDVLMEAGAPMQIVLPAPLTVQRERVIAAVQQYSAQVASTPPPIVQPPPKPKTCYDPGTPDTVIPGSPGTPPQVIPGGPGMPDTVIPGMPATPDTVIPGTPGRYYPCK